MTQSRPSAFGGLLLIIKRELAGYFGSMSGWIIAAAVLFTTGIFFNFDAVGTGSKFSAEVLETFFKDASFVTGIGAILISMRLIAEERQSGTLPLLLNSSLTEGEIILAKFLSAWLFVILLTTMTAYMPLMIFVRGKISFGHLFAGYGGLYLFGGAITAIGLFGSSLTRSQLLGAVISGAITAVAIMLWMAARAVDGPLGDLIGQLALFDKHFMPFMRGTIALADIIYYFSVMAFFLVLARNGLESRRWSS